MAPHPYQPDEPAALSDPREVLAAILDPQRRGELYPYYHRLRELEPIHPTDQLSLERAWVLSDHRNVQIFDVGPPGEHFFRMMTRQLLFLERADHDRIRGLVAHRFTPRAVEALRPRIQGVVEQLLKALVGRGQLDLVADFAYPLPVHVICELLGVPQADVPHFMTWAHDFARRGDVSGLDDEIICRGEEATLGFERYFAELIAARRRRPGDDLLSVLLGLEDARGRLSDDEIVATCVILLQAGHNTTADLIGMGVRALLRERAQWERLCREPELIPRAVEELIRYDTSVQISQRVGPEPIEVGGVKIPAGEMCVLLNGAANRDPARFAQPDRLDVTRADVEHLGFGLGVYVCLGKSVARAEIQSALGALVQHVPMLQLDADTARWRPSLFLRGLESLPVRW
jgi:hypothetical protein